MHAQTETATYDFATCTPGTDCFASKESTKNPDEIDNVRLGPAECRTVLSAGNYTAVSVSDATGGDADPNRYTAPDPGGSDESCTIFEFELQQDETTITQIEITWEGYGDASHVVNLYVWDYSQGCYSNGQGTCMSSGSYNNPAATGSGTADFVLTETITSNIANFVDEATGNELTYLIIDKNGSEQVFHDYTKAAVTYSVLADLTGTLADGAVDGLIVAGGETLIITLTNDTWDATIGADNAKTDALIAGIDSAQSEPAGWDAEVRANLDYNDVTRTSDTVVTITLGAEANYAITANETITVTVPATALAGTNAVVATPTFVIFSVTPTSFGYRKSVTIDRTKVGTGTAPATLPNLPAALLGHRRRPEEHRQRGRCHQHERSRHPVPGAGRHDLWRHRPLHAEPRDRILRPGDRAAGGVGTRALGQHEHGRLRHRPLHLLRQQRHRHVNSGRSGCLGRGPPDGPTSQRGLRHGHGFNPERQ